MFLSNLVRKMQRYEGLWDLLSSNQTWPCHSDFVTSGTGTFQVLGKSSCEDVIGGIAHARQRICNALAWIPLCLLPLLLTFFGSKVAGDICGGFWQAAYEMPLTRRQDQLYQNFKMIALNNTLWRCYGRCCFVSLMATFSPPLHSQVKLCITPMFNHRSESIASRAKCEV